VYKFTIGVLTARRFEQEARRMKRGDDFGFRIADWRLELMAVLYGLGVESVPLDREGKRGSSGTSAHRGKYERDGGGSLAFDGSALSRISNCETRLTTNVCGSSAREPIYLINGNHYI
jgi:hypothetical protein